MKYREITVFENHFWDFYNRQNLKVQIRIDWTFKLVQELEVIPEKYFKKLTGTDLYEIRIKSGGNIYRIFCFFDKGKLVILLNAFQKKSQKTPKREIEKALNLQRKYYEGRKN